MSAYVFVCVFVCVCVRLCVCAFADAFACARMRQSLSLSVLTACTEWKGCNLKCKSFCSSCHREWQQVIRPMSDGASGPVQMEIELRWVENSINLATGEVSLTGGSRKCQLVSRVTSVRGSHNKLTRLLLQRQLGQVNWTLSRPESSGHQDK